MNPLRRKIVLTLALIASGLVAGILLESRLDRAAPPAVATTTRYICPMHPDVVRDAPGNCPVCGMALVAHNEHEHATETPAVTLASGEVTALNVRTEPARRETLWREARLSAYVQGYGAGGTLSLQAPVAGRVAALPVPAGRNVRQHDVLAEIESPAFIAEQSEFLAALSNGDNNTIEASRQRLNALGLDPSDLAQIEKTRHADPRLRLRAPLDAQIAALNARAGDNIEANVALLALQTPGQASVDVELYRSELLWMKTGDRAELRLPQTPGRIWRGSVSMEGVLANPQRRTFLVRLQFPMPAGVVTGSMTGEARILGGARNALSVPRDALIRTEHESRVVLALGNGRFRPVVVTPGIESGERIEILAGLRDGDTVVTNAQFLIDAESSQRAEFRRLSADASR